MDLIDMKERTNFIVVVITFFLSSFIFYQWRTNANFKRDFISLYQKMIIFDFHYNAKYAKTAPEKRDVLVKIAAYNEEDNIGEVLAKMPKNVDVLVIDDGSTDNTAKVAQRQGALVARHYKNMGQGIAAITGFIIAFNREYKFIVEMDADGQHDPSDIPLFINFLNNNPDVDIVVGSRILGGQDSNACKIRTRFLPVYTKMINWATGYSLTDGLCGFKAYRASSLMKHPVVFQDLIESEYIVAEMYIRFAKAGLKVADIPIYVSQRKYGNSRKGTFRYGIAVAWIIIMALLKK